MNSELIPEAHEPAGPRSPVEDEQLGGCVWMLIWTAFATLAFGASLIGLVLVAPRTSGYTGFFALLFVACGVAGAGLAVILAIADRAVHRTPPRWRFLAGLLMAIIGAASLTPGVAVLAHWEAFPFDTSWPAIAGATLVVLALVIASGRTERRAALAFASTWVLLWATVGYHTATDMRVAVVWLGPAIDGRAQVAFAATRSADYEIRFRAPSCGAGRVIATGHYAFAPDRAEIGRIEWVDLPIDILPLQGGDLVRVCLRDGFAAATAAGEKGAPAAGPSSFWPRD
jgi:hypothetical protein